jgi:carboxypeptidase Taq
MSTALYDELVEKSREIALLQSISGLLGWDQETMMPRGGEGLRARQMAMLAGMVHERGTSERIGALLSELESSTWLKSDAPAHARANVGELRRVFDRARKIPRALAVELAGTIPIAQGAWAAARKANDFASFRPHLEKIVKLKREEARAVAPSGGDLYEALLDEFEPGMKAKDAEKMINDLAAGLVPIVAAIAQKPNPPSPLVGRAYDVEKQKVLCAMIPPALGLIASESRLDVSAHPFSQRIGQGDVRITTRFDATDLRGAFFGVMHETGHALYEQGLDPAHDGTPAGEARSVSVHESQSRLWENLVGRSTPFWKHWFPVLRSLFPDSLGDVELDQFVHGANRVEPSLIRVEADEVTYNLHIVVRMRIERKLIAGDLEVKDIPAMWNEEIKSMLGIDVPDDRRGCLQDIHWSMGAFAYFPTYAIGNMFAAQLMEAARRELINIDQQIEMADYTALLAWLRKHVHRRGAQAPGVKIVEDATGKKPDASAFLRYVKDKFTPLYGL